MSQKVLDALKAAHGSAIERVESQLTAANFAGITLQLEDGWADARTEVGD